MAVSGRIGTGLVIGACLLGSGCSSGSGPHAGAAGAAATAAPAANAAAERVSIAEIGRQPSRYVGRRVTIEGPVATVESESAFSLGEQGGGSGRGLLVVVPDRSDVLPAQGRLTVSGSVRLFDRHALQSQYGWMASTPEIEARYGGHPVVVAESVRTADGRELAGRRRLPASSGELGPSGLRQGAPGTDHDRQQR